MSKKVTITYSVTYDLHKGKIADEYKEQLVVLQKIFALCSEAGYLPDKEELTLQNFPALTHKIMRKIGDKRLYSGAF